MKQVIKSDPERVQINVILEGDEAKRFRHYMERQKLKTKAPAAYRLMIERLEQVEAEAAAA
jgi:hypothetical protein